MAVIDLNLWQIVMVFVALNILTMGGVLIGLLTAHLIIEKSTKKPGGKK